MFSRAGRKKNVRKDGVIRRYSLFPLIVAYYCVSSVFLFWEVESFAKDMIVAPLYFVMPMGIGLLLFSLAGTHRQLVDSVGAAALILVGTFVGMVAVTLIYQDAERSQLLSVWFPFLYPGVFVLSLIGCIRTRSLFTVDDAELKSAARTLFWLAPVALLSYYFLFLKFSSFPLRDIFQETHFMKGAHELSRFQVLNPYITASYLSVIQVHLGILNHFYKYDLINSQWILPVYAYFFHLGCYAVFFRMLVREISGVRLALALATGFGTMFFVENMIMLESILLVFFVILVRMNAGATAPVKDAFSTAFWLLLLFIVYSIHFNYLFVDHHVFSGIPSPYSGLWVIGLFMFYLGSRLRIPAATNLFFLVFMAISMFAMHRGILLFFPIILFLYLTHAAVFSGRIFGRDDRKYSLVRAIFFGFALVAAIILLVDYALTNSQVGNPSWTSSTAFRIGEVLLRTPVMEGGGTGFNHSLVEYLRVSPPLMLLVVFVLLLLYVAYPRLSRALLDGTSIARIDPSSDVRAVHLNQVLFLVLVVPVLALLVLSTIPYVYRGAFFPSILTISLVAILFEFYRRTYFSAPSVRSARFWVLLMVASAITAHFVLYGFSGNLAGNDNPYLEALFPLPQFGLLSLILLSVAVYFRRVGHTVAIAMVSASLVVVVVMDTLNFKTMFYDKAYGPQIPESGVISHYTEQELEMGGMLKALPAKSLLVSDPYTLSILRAVTGLNSVYSFANINIVTKPKLYQDTFKLISRLGETDAQQARDQLYWLSDAIRTKTAAEGFYIWNKFHIRGQGELMSASQMYDHFIWVVNAKTFQWAKGLDTYYPDNTRLDDDFIAHLERYFNVFINLDNRVIAFRLKRSVTPSVLPEKLCDSDYVYKSEQPSLRAF